MILPDAQYDVIFKALCEENEKVRFTCDKQNKKILKQFNRELRIDNVYYSTYTIPKSRNKYLICSAKTKKHKGLLTLGYLEVQEYNDRKFYLHYDVMGMQMLLQFNSHFFHRYRERILKNSSVPTEYVLSDFQSRQMDFDDIKPEKVLLDKDKYGEYNKVMILDGHLLAVNFFKYEAKNSNILKNDLYITEFKTVISNEMLKPNQKKAVQEILDQNKKLEKLIMFHTTNTNLKTPWTTRP